MQRLLAQGNAKGVSVDDWGASGEKTGVKRAAAVTFSDRLCRNGYARGHLKGLDFKTRFLAALGMTR